LNELFKQSKSYNWLIHWHHVTGIVNSQELEVLESLKLASWLTINSPFLVRCCLEVFLALPLNSIGPSLTSSPVADKIFVTRIDKDIKT
jgi:hypothetical protein